MSVGSSPHTRGAPYTITKSFPVAGIIPAYAGSTAPSHGIRAAAGDHPRIRGEHSRQCLRQLATKGSSPHTRGAPGVASDGKCRKRIIPAYAGSTFPKSPSPAPLPGSSPHTRGARSGVHRHRRPGRIIPAYAGSTPTSSSPGRSSTDHPRIRGEHSGLARVDPQGEGSSPHTRGARWVTGWRTLVSRIIPAYAGSTCRCR